MSGFLAGGGGVRVRLDLKPQDPSTAAPLGFGLVSAFQLNRERLGTHC
jgi:hypothetical protein